MTLDADIKILQLDIKEIFTVLDQISRYPEDPTYMGAFVTSALLCLLSVNSRNKEHYEAMVQDAITNLNFSKENIYSGTEEQRERFKNLTKERKDLC